jgi:hypothetical protein
MVSPGGGGILRRMHRALFTWKQQWLGVVAAALLSASVGALSGCAPAECKDVKPLMTDIRGALSKRELKSVLPPAEKLHAALESSTHPELKMFSVRTDGLVKAIKAAQTSESDPDRRNFMISELDFAIDAWQKAAATVDVEVCK